MDKLLGLRSANNHVMNHPGRLPALAQARRAGI